MIVVGIDPGTGVSSPTGIAVFQPNPMPTIIDSFDIQVYEKHIDKRIQRICSQLTPYLHDLTKYNPETKVLVSIETFVMRGKAGQNLQQLIGGIISNIPQQHDIVHIYNTTVKKIVGGNGRADKALVAEGVLNYFSEYDEAHLTIKNLIIGQKWDTLDAFAIGIAGLKQREQS